MQFAGEVDATEVPVEGPGVTHLCLQSPAKNALFDKLIKHKAKSVSTGNPPIDLNEAGGCVMAMFVMPITSCSRLNSLTNRALKVRSG